MSLPAIGGLGAKACVVFYYFNFEGNYGLFKSKSAFFSEKEEL